jgi:hypothetical protein
MNMQTPSQSNPLLEAIGHQLSLIADTNQQIKQWSAAEGNESLMVRQYKHLRKQMVQELDRLLRQLDLTLQVVEV